MFLKIFLPLLKLFSLYKQDSIQSDGEKLATILSMNESIENKLNNLSILMSETKLVDELSLENEKLKQMVDWNQKLNFCHSSLSDEFKILWQDLPKDKRPKIKKKRKLYSV